MFPVVFYVFVILFALLWVTLDTEAASVFDIFRPGVHATAQGMGMYWSWVASCFWRCTLLLSLLVMNAAASFWVLEQNSLALELFSRRSVFGFMLVGSLTILFLPLISTRIRFWKKLRDKVADLSDLVSLLSSEEEILRHLQPADYDTESGWTAWHPQDEEWQEDGIWTGVVPVVYLLDKTTSSLIFPFDWEFFLAWKLPKGSVQPGYLLPVSGPGGTVFHVKSVDDLKKHPHWSVIRANIKMESEAA